MLSSLAAAAATMGLVTIGGITLAGGGLVFGSGVKEALFFYARTVSSGDLFVSSSSDSCFLPVQWVAVSLSLSAAMMWILSASSGLVHWFLLQ